MEPENGDRSWKPGPGEPAAALIYVSRAERHLKSPTAFPGSKRQAVPLGRRAAFGRGQKTCAGPGRKACLRDARSIGSAAFANALVAQLDRAPDYEFGGQEFESLRARHHLEASSIKNWIWVTPGVTRTIKFAPETAAMDPELSRKAGNSALKSRTLIAARHILMQFDSGKIGDRTYRT